MTPMMMGDWAGYTAEEVWADMEGSWEDAESVNAARPRFSILAAYSEVDGYEGSAYLLLSKDGALYEVTSSHCSCYGHTFGEPGQVVKEYVLGQFTHASWAPFRAHYAIDRATVDAFRAFVEAL